VSPLDLERAVTVAQRCPTSTPGSRDRSDHSQGHAGGVPRDLRAVAASRIFVQHPYLRFLKDAKTADDFRGRYVRLTEHCRAWYTASPSERLTAPAIIEPATDGCAMRETQTRASHPTHHIEERHRANVGTLRCRLPLEALARQLWHASRAHVPASVRQIPNRIIARLNGSLPHALPPGIRTRP